jgi:hypothetical protein
MAGGVAHRYERGVLKLERRLAQLTSGLVGSPFQVTLSVTAAHAVAFVVTLLAIMLLTAENRWSDGVESAAVASALFTSCLAVVVCASCYSIINDRQRFDIDTMTYCRNVTLLLSALRPASVLVAISLFVAASHWFFTLAAFVAASVEVYTCSIHPERRVFDATTLFKHHKHAKRAAVVGGVLSCVFIVYSGAHITGIILRSLLGLAIRLTARAGKPYDFSLRN